MVVIVSICGPSPARSKISYVCCRDFCARQCFTRESALRPQQHGRALGETRAARAVGQRYWRTRWETAELQAGKGTAVLKA
eukprot:512329-Pleurochrysis_carterae.AAC.1